MHNQQYFIQLNLCVYFVLQFLVIDTVLIFFDIKKCLCQSFRSLNQEWELNYISGKKSEPVVKNVTTIDARNFSDDNSAA